MKTTLQTAAIVAVFVIIIGAGILMALLCPEAMLHHRPWR